MPNLNSRQYFEKREVEKLKKGLRDIKNVEKELVKAYKKAMKDMQKEILSLYGKYAIDNKLNYSEACKKLNSSEFKSFRMDLKEYMKLIDDENILLQLNTLSTKGRISRLEELFYQCSKYIDEIYGTSNKHLQVCFSNTVKDNYYQSIFDTHKFIGVGTSFALIDDVLVKELLSYPWSGKDWSSRIWENRTKLRKAFEEEFTQMIIQGKGTREVSRALSKRLDADFKNCMRLVHTEHAYFMEKASHLAYKETDVDKYEILATLDNRTSEICQKLDGKVYKVSEAIVGVNMPPFHPRCRTTTIPYFKENGVRFARDEKGKGIEVPSNMKYEEWAKIYKI